MAILNIQLGLNDIQTDMVPKANGPHTSPGNQPSIQILPGHALYSPTGAFRFVFGAQGPDGVARVQVITDSQLPNLVWTDIWTTNTAEKGGFELDMQLDGNLVIYSGAGPIFSTLGSGFQPVNPFLRMQDDGNLVIYDEHGQAFWSTRTNARGI
jgi:hypothetical protein